MYKKMKNVACHLVKVDGVARIKNKILATNLLVKNNKGFKQDFFQYFFNLI